jgi:hypothetical protein
MDIHKPKPVHSIREFLSEIAVVVCGILIAIALEQGVEALHAGHETETLDRALRIEVKHDLGEAFQEAANFYCVRAQTHAAIEMLNRSGDWPGAQPTRPDLTAADYGNSVFMSPAAPDAESVSGGDTPAQRNLFAPGGAAPRLIPLPRSAIAEANWQAAASTPALLHMDRRRRDFYAQIYWDAHHLEEAVDDSVLVRFDLASLAYPQKLTPEERRRYVERFAHLDDDNREVFALAGLMSAMAGRIGIAPDPNDIEERLKSLRGMGFGGCLKPFVTPQKSLDWAKKFDADYTRFGRGAD